MMAGNPNTLSLCLQSSSHHHHHLSMNNTSQSQFVYGSTNTTASGFVDNHNPIGESPLRSWSHLLLLGEDKDRYGELEQEGLSLNHCSSYTRRPVVHDMHAVDVKQEQLLQPSTCQLYDYAHNHDEIIHQNIVTSSEYYWPVQQNQSALSNGFLNFSGGNKVHQVEDKNQNQHQHNQDQSSECTSTKAGRLCKKARVQQSSSKPALKVRKEKLGDRITALHQLVSPFGKTDTASVLSEAIGYIRFLQGQIEALSTPYMHNATSATHHQHSEYQSQGDLRLLGLCLVPISCTQNVGNYTSNEYWVPAAFGRGF